MTKHPTLPVRRSLPLVVALLLVANAHPAGAQTATAPDRPNVLGIGGAGAFIPDAHLNGPFGAGGPLAGIGGAGAFIPHP